MLRIKPYTTSQTNWGTILDMKLTIPMNQREYSWTKTELIQFINDTKHIFEDTKYIEKLGSIINYKGNGNNEIYDGQQRTITTILILIVIANKCKLKRIAVYNAIMAKLSINTEIDNLTERDLKLKQKFNYIENLILPKMYCVNPYDIEALINIFNNKVFSYMNFVKNIDDFIDNFNNDNFNNNIMQNIDNDINDENNHSFICNHSYHDDKKQIIICNESIGRKADFIKHLKNIHNIDCTYLKSSKIYEAYNYIFEQLTLFNYDDEKLKNLYKFIIEDIDIQLYDCSDSIYVSKIFDWENNRGKNVVKLDLVKNPILTNIPDDKKYEIYTEWEKLKKTESKTVKDFGEKIFDIAIQLYNNFIERKVNYEKMYKPIIDNNPNIADNKTLDNTNKFFKIIYKLIEIYIKIENHKYGRLLTNSPRISLAWEAYMFCLLPIFYKINTIDDNLIILFTKWYFRNIVTIKHRTFNNLSYSNNFIDISNEVLNDKEIDKNKKYNYYNKIEKILKDNIDESINKNNYIEIIENEILFKHTNATYILLFLETCLSTDIQQISLEYTLEHIYPQKDKLHLKNGKNIDRIGNLTLLEGKNSSNGHKGNSSCGAKEYSKKKESYKGSSSRITMDIPLKYESKFNEEDIIKRTKFIAEQLNKYTLY